MRYASIVFIMESNDPQVSTFLDGIEGIYSLLVKEKLLEYLKQWGNGEYHEISDNPSYGASDTTYQVGDYLVSYNTRLGYVGLDIILRE